MRMLLSLAAMLLVGCYDLTPLPSIDAGLEDASPDDVGVPIDAADTAEGGG
jgi:hypothetical protein